MKYYYMPLMLYGASFLLLTTSYQSARGTYTPQELSIKTTALEKNGDKNAGPQLQPFWTWSKKIALVCGSSIGLLLGIDLITRTKDSLLATGWSKLTESTGTSTNQPPQTFKGPDTQSQKREDVQLPPTLQQSKAIPLGTAGIRKPQVDYFQHIMGKPEAEVKAALIKRLKEKKLPFDWFRKTPAQHAEISAVMDELFPLDKRPSSLTQGDFQTYTIQELIDATDKAAPVGDKASFTFLFDPQRKKSRVEYLQTLPENKDALFQLASNHNALEAHSHGNKCGGILNHWSCGVQGELASLSAGGAAIKRIYLTPPINLLEHFDPHNYKTVRIGLHSNIQVTSGYLDTTDQYYALNNPNQTINQVFSFTCDKRAHGNYDYSSFLKESVTMDTIEQSLLYATYEGTLRLAVQTKKKKVFLTLVGGGAFQNRLDTVAQAITRMKDFIKAKKLDVTLVYFSDRTPEVVAGENDRFHKAMAAMATEINQ